MDLGTVRRVDIEEKMRSAYLSYAMSVITARALPDVRDGLKPVQRRILYAMYDMGLRHDRPTRKSARIVGEVLGKYHPHGDAAVYEAMVRMAQDFTMRYPLIDGQGNFGSIDGDSAAAIRYTEARLTALGEEMLVDLDKDAVDFVENFDNSLREPQVLPARLPNLLVNGVGGIAVGMATNIPPHNIGEILDAVIHLIDHYDHVDDVTLEDLMHHVKGPDFPTGGIILGEEGIRQAYATGRGSIVIRSQIHREELSGGRLALVVTELPYQVNKATLVSRIATLARDGRVDGISDLRDESDRTGIRIVIELKRGADWESVVAALLKHSQLQATFGVNMLALVDGEPRTLSLKRALLHYIEHRYHVIERRTRYELERALQRAHILEGLLIALDHLDEVIDTIRRSRTVETARMNLQKKFNLSEAQAQAILEMQLRRLAALERRRIQEEYRQVAERIAYLRDLLSDEAKLRGVIKEEALEMKRLYGDPRRTRISALEASTEVKAGDLLPDEELVIVMDHQESVRQFPLSACSPEKEGFLSAMAEAGLAVKSILRANAQNKVVFLTSQGKAFGVGAHELPDGRQQPMGQPITTLTHLQEDETIIGMIAVPRGNPQGFLALATKQGRIKRVALEEIASLNRDPSKVIGLEEDHLVGALVTEGSGDLVMVTAKGQVIRFSENQVRPQGLPAMGVKGIELKEGDQVVALAMAQEEGHLLVATANGFAKRTPFREYTPQGRGGTGALTVDASKEKLTGPITAACAVREQESVILATTRGRMVWHPVEKIPALARDTWGNIVTRTRHNAVIHLEEGETLASCVCFSPPMEKETSPSKPAKGKAEQQSSAPKRRASQKEKVEPTESPQAKASSRKRASSAED